MSLFDAIIRKEEGCRLTVYRDTEGFLTVGWGHKVLPEDDLEEGDSITPLFAEKLLNIDKAKAMLAVKHEFGSPSWFDAIGEGRQAVLYAMAFQLGITGLAKFKKMLGFLERDLWDDAVGEMLDSKWAKQTPARANRMAHIICTNETSYYEE